MELLIFYSWLTTMGFHTELPKGKQKQFIMPKIRSSPVSDVRYQSDKNPARRTDPYKRMAKPTRDDWSDDYSEELEIQKEISTHVKRLVEEKKVTNDPETST
jgi:hypothetical protein